MLFRQIQDDLHALQMIGDGDPARMVAAGPDRNGPGFGDYHWFRLRSRGLVGFQEERVEQQLVGVHFLGPAAVDPAQKLLHLARPSLSQYSSLTRLRCRLQNTNRKPEIG